MTTGLYSPADLELIFDGKLFDSIFGILRRIWNPNKKGISQYYRDGEIESNRLEKSLLELHPSLYDELIDCCNNENVAEKTRQEDKYCLVLMDSLSLREAMLLEDDFKKDYNVKVGYSFSTLPSETEAFKQRIFRRINISQWNNPNFKYIHDLSSMSVFPESNKLTIWTQIPDNKIHHTRAGHSEPWSMEEIYTDIKQLVNEILITCRHENVVITSDHGYVDLTAGCTFPIGDKWKKMLRNQFKKRWKKKENNWELELLYDQKYIRYSGENYIVQGRYSWTTGRGRVNTRRHGGISIMECMTPALIIGGK